MSIAVPRLSWGVLPARVREAAETALGSKVDREEVQTGGFSPGLASRLGLADGRRVFAKAINAERDPDAPGLYRREAAVMAAMPERVPAPRLLWSMDDGDWVMLVLECVDGSMPQVPWVQPELERVVTALAGLSVLLTPSPMALPSVVEDLAGNFSSWRTLSQAPASAEGLDPWAVANLDALAELESRWAQAAKGDTMLHTDLRADNLLLTSDKVVVVDWPYAAIGARWVDLLFLLPSAAAHGTDPAQVWDSYWPARDADPGAVNAVLAAVAGDFLFQSLKPAPVNLPALRAHQRDKGQAALDWLRSRLP